MPKHNEESEHEAYRAEIGSKERDEPGCTEAARERHQVVRTGKRRVVGSRGRTTRTHIPNVAPRSFQDDRTSSGSAHHLRQFR